MEQQRGSAGGVKRRLLEGTKEIADHLGLQASGGADRRRRLLTLVRAGLPAWRAGGAGAWCAYAHELDGWVERQKSATRAQFGWG